jgi:prepilin-type N-terminal cleavage/methylation domain-containing protein
MTPEIRSKSAGATWSEGFTLVEFIVALALVVIIITIATPSIRNWRPGLDAKQEATTMVNFLREARSKSVATNYQYKVDFDLPNRQYRMQRGSRAYNTPDTEWADVSGNGWTKLSNEVTFKSGTACDSTDTVDVKFNANGTASLETPWTTVSAAPVTVCIQGGTGAKLYQILVSKAGIVMLR